MNLTELIFALFPATSNGEKPLLKTRKVSGKDGSCEKYHMKLHIYVCIPGKGEIINIRIIESNEHQSYIVCILKARSNEDES